jgi:hypothetical protein
VRTTGLLKRSPVIAAGFRYIGKETDRRSEQGGDLSILDPKVVEYRPDETEMLVADPEPQRDLRRFSIRAAARAAGVSEKTVKAARRGDRLRKSTRHKLRALLNRNPAQL